MKVTRAQLAKFCPDNETIRAFEDLANTAERADSSAGALTIVPAVSAPDMALVTAASVSVAANASYKFEFFGTYSVASAAVGSRWTVDGPAAVVVYSSEYTLTSTSRTNNSANAYGLPAAANASSADGNTVKIEGIVTPSANGLLSIQFASGGASAVNLLGGYLRLIRLT